MVVPERINWAVAMLDVQPDDVILEIGCGNGAAVSLVCDRLVSGHITAIDRSEKMIDLARRNNLHSLETGRADILHTSIETAQFSPKFSKVFLFNLNVFWMDPVVELAVVSRVLAESGKFYIFHNPPPGSELEEFAQAITKNLERNGFKPDDPVYNRQLRSLCVKSTHR